MLACKIKVFPVTLTHYCIISTCKLQKSPKLSIDLVCMMEEVDNISPVLADTVMDAGYHAIDVQFSGVSIAIRIIFNYGVF